MNKQIIQVIKLNSLLITCSMLLVSTAHAQDCSEKMKLAENAYDAGNIEMVKPLLSACLKRGFTNEEKIRAHKLLAEVYLVDDMHDSSSFHMKEILKIDPEYETSNSDKKELQQLYGSYKRGPLLYLGAFVGLNSSMVQPQTTYSTVGTANNTKSYASDGLGIFFGLEISKYINKNIDILFKPQYAGVKYAVTENIYNEITTTYSEEQAGIYLPLTVSYCIRFGNIFPYLQAGVGYSALLNATGKAIRSYNNNSHNDIEANEIDVMPQRVSSDIRGIVGLGVRYKIKRTQFVLDVTYNTGLTQQVQTNERYNNHEILYNFYYVDNDYLMNHLDISLGVRYAFYKTKSVSK